jgi:hypothetical protein
MITAQEIINTVQRLPLSEQEKVLEVLQSEINLPKSPISEEEVQRILFERGVIGNIPNAADYTDADDDFEPIEIKGKPLSETVIEERR